MSLIPCIEYLATFLVEVIEPVPSKKACILCNMSISFMLTSIINLACTWYPIRLLELLVMFMLKQPSPSTNPVTYQGFNGLFSKE